MVCAVKLVDDWRKYNLLAVIPNKVNKVGE
jgi:hypothetical protein